MVEGLASRPLDRSDWGWLGVFALLKLLIHLPVLGRYGFHHDELYFLACGRHLAFGYVDHPPLVPWIARLADELFGPSLVGLRMFSLLAGVGTVVLTAVIVRRLGGGRFAQVIACLAMMVAPDFVRPTAVFCIPAFEQPLWILGTYLLLRLIQDENPRLWLWLGVVAGVGLLTKHSMLFFGFGLLAALLLTPLRRYLRTVWPYAGGAVAALLFLPNLLWQLQNDWPTLQFMRNLNAGTMSGIPVLQFIAGQVLYVNPVTAPIWITGLVYFFRASGKPYRALGWMFVSVFVLLVLLKSKIYYLAPAYPALLAAGAVTFEELVRRRTWAWLRPVTLGGLFLGGIVFAPLSLPILPINLTDRYITALTFGAFENVYEVTGDLHGMFGWRERVRIVAGVWNRLDPEERNRAVIYAPWYGSAAAVDYFGRDYGLPNAVSGHMTYYLWGLPKRPIDTVVAVDDRVEPFQKAFREVTIAAEAELRDVNPWEKHFQVILCRGAKVDLHEKWPRLRRW